MKKKIIIRLSNNLGNQMFMYAASFAFAKKLNRELLIDEQSSYLNKGNIYTYNLDIFDFKSKIASSNYKFIGNFGHIKRKLFKYFDKLNKIKKFYIEPRDKNKITLFDNNAVKGKFNDILYMEGHFETEKYFKDHTDDLKNEFTFKNINAFQNTQIYKDIKNSNAVSICVRQNRFSERKRPLTRKDDLDSSIFTSDQIRYINKAIKIMKSKIDNPKFFLWSNDLTNLGNSFSFNNYTPVSTNKIDLDLYLMSQSKHFIVIPSSYNWWGAWLGQDKNSIILRPSNDHFSNFRLNNKDFWPKNWTKV